MASMHQTWTTQSKELGDTIRLEFTLGQAMLNTGQVRDGICACVWRYLGAHLCRPNSSVTQLTKRDRATGRQPAGQFYERPELVLPQFADGSCQNVIYTSDARRGRGPG